MNSHTKILIADQSCRLDSTKCITTYEGYLVGMIVFAVIISVVVMVNRATNSVVTKSNNKRKCKLCPRRTLKEDICHKCRRKDPNYVPKMTK